MKQLGPRISKELYKKVINKCIDEDKSVNQVITELLTGWVGEEVKIPSPPQKEEEVKYPHRPRFVSGFPLDYDD